MKTYQPIRWWQALLLIIVVVAATAVTVWALTVANQFLIPDADGAEPAPALETKACKDNYHRVVNKAYDSHRWYTRARRDPTRHSERRRIAWLKGCADQDGSIRRHAQDKYWRFYRKVIAPTTCAGRRYATPCHVPECESGYGAAAHNIYGLKNAWYEHWLPVKGNDTGTRFASSGFSSGASKLEQDVMGSVSLDHGAYWEPCG